METTPSSSRPRTTKVRTTKSAGPKSSVPAKKPVETKPVAAKPVAAKPKAAAAPRKRKTLTIAPQSPASADLTPMIATAAYYLAEQRQFAAGYEMQDWLAAEQLVRASMIGK